MQKKVFSGKINKLKLNWELCLSFSNITVDFNSSYAFFYPGQTVRLKSCFQNHH